MMRIVIVGGGAAGFFAAIQSARRNSKAQVLLLDAGRHFLDKVRISGGGRCNVTHACFDPAALVASYPRGSKALRGPFSHFQPKDTIAWFNKEGVELKTEADGRMFPVTNDSATIVDCLMNAAQKAGVKLRSNCAVGSIEKVEDSFVLKLKNGETLKADRLLLATGGSRQGFQLAAELGHKTEPPVPSIFTFNIAEQALRELAGVSVQKAKAVLQVGKKKIEQSGPLLITHWGMSGPAILKLSAFGARLLQESKYQATLRVNWLPELKEQEVREFLAKQKAGEVRKQVGNLMPQKFELPNRLWRFLLQRANISLETRWAEVSKKALNALLVQLAQGEFQVCGKGKFKEEFVTCGGVRLKEVDFKTMESRVSPGLFFAGEILDIDGITGGFNFQNAWSTAWIAGRAMGK